MRRLSRGAAGMQPKSSRDLAEIRTSTTTSPRRRRRAQHKPQPRPSLVSNARSLPYSTTYGDPRKVPRRFRQGAAKAVLSPHPLRQLCGERLVRRVPDHSWMDQ